MPETDTATVEQVSAQPPTASDGQTPEEEFDRPRAMATIQKLRELEKESKAKLATYEKAQADAAKTASAAERTRLTEQGEYKKLAEDAEKRAADLEPYKAKAERNEASLTKLLTEERKGLPKHITALLDKMDAADQLDYIAENRAVLTAPAQAPPPNINGTAGTGGKPAFDPQAREAELTARYRI